MRQKLAELINIIFGFRKFILMILLFLVGVIFRIENLLNGAEMVDLFKSTTIAFFGANGVEHIMTTVQGYYKSKGSQGADQADNLVPDVPDAPPAQGPEAPENK